MTDGVRSGVRWSSISAIVLRLSSFVVGIITARLVSPDQFGAFAVALSVFGIVAMVSDMGVSQAIAKEVHRTAAIAPTAMTLNIGTAALSSIVLFVLAPTIATGLGAPDATDATRVLGLTILAGSLGTVPAMILTRDYRQRERFLSDLLNFLVGAVALIVLARMGYGALALAWSRLLGQLVSAAVLNTVNKERYWFGLNREELGPLLRFSLPLAGAGALGVLITNIDTLVIARLLDTTQLGYYNLAFNVGSWPIAVFSSILISITIPTFARDADNPEELRSHLIAAMASLAAAALPTSALLISLSSSVISDLYGPRWLPAAPVLAVLGLSTMVRLIQILIGDVLIALGHTRPLLGAQLIWVLALVPAMVVGVRLGGVIGAAWAHIVVGTLVVLPTYVVLLRRAVHIRGGWVRRTFLQPTVSSVLAGLSAWTVSLVITNPWASLVVGSAVALSVYAITSLRWLRGLLLWVRVRYEG